MALLKVIENRIEILDDRLLNHHICKEFEAFYFNDHIINCSFKELFSLPENKFCGLIIKDNRIFIFRDRFSPIPLYYNKTNSSEWFVSERFSNLKNFFCHKKVTKSRFLKIKNGNTDDLSDTFFKKIKRVIPGKMIQCANEKVFNVKKRIDDVNGFEYDFKSIIKNETIKKGSYATLLSEGADSGAVSYTLKELRIKNKNYSIIFDKESETIIKSRDEDVISFYPEELKDYISGKGFESIEYDFNPNANMFIPVLKKMKKDGITDVFMGVGGDEIHGSDFPVSFFWDCIIRGYFDQLRFSRKFFLFVLLNYPKGIHRGSFLKYQINRVINSNFLIFNLEKIWKFFIEYGIYVHFPFYDSRLINNIMNSSILDIVKFNKESGYLIKQKDLLFLNTVYRKRNFLDIILSELELTREDYKEWLDERAWHLFKKELENLCK
ncbi:MAG: hypothetical protein C0601_10945 [Candidatus Muiribacterium halophilum]|uniref:Uncharacterized protein n=1 Tax=Muiribacterium halophilum TaxID=2053465 RepID=A0A2N5ZBS1_MUIH1|nr:MAG: hypothetical protein C0601_10945 [Candidatus Muirbacterium halophilum]